MKTYLFIMSEQFRLIIIIIICIIIGFVCDQIYIRMTSSSEKTKNSNIINKKDLRVILLNKKIREITDELIYIRKFNNELLEIEKKYNELRIRKVAVAAYLVDGDRDDENFLISAINTKIIPGHHCAVSRDLIYMLNKQVYIDSYGTYKVVDVVDKGDSKIHIFVPNQECYMNFNDNKKVNVTLIRE